MLVNRYQLNGQVSVKWPPSGAMHSPGIAELSGAHSPLPHGAHSYSGCGPWWESGLGGGSF